MEPGRVPMHKPSNAVKPNVLAPRQQGIYEFEYEGNKTTGFSRYRVTKLLSKNGEVKFKTPNQ